MKFDELIERVGGFSPYQKRIFVLVSMATLASAAISMSPIFMLDIPNYRCAIPGYDNDTYSIQNDQHQELVNLTVPVVVDSEGETTYSQCKLYNMTEMTPGVNRTQYECTNWVYDTSVIQSSGITDFDMVCQNEILRSHSNMIAAAGGLPGSIIFGILADVCGRKKTLILSAVLTTATSLGAAFSPNYDIYVAVVFFVNLVGLALYMVSFVMVMEYVGPSRRTLVGIGIDVFWVLGLFVLNLAAFLFREWRHLRLVIGVPPILFVLYWWIVPESPRWLISKGRTEEAAKILRKMAEANKVELEEEMMKNVTLEEEEKTVPIWKMFTSPVLILRTFIILFNWYIIPLTYYGLSLNVGNLSGGIYLNFFLSTLMELVAYVGCYFLLMRFGRRTMLSATHIVGGLACLATIFPVVYGDSSLNWTVTALSLVGKLGSSATFAIIYIVTAELLPTVVRQSGMAVCSLFDMFGAMTAPYMADLGLLEKGSLADALPLIVFGSLTVAAGLLSLLLPETKDSLLPETIQDAIHIGRKEKSNSYNLEVQQK